MKYYIVDLIFSLISITVLFSACGNAADSNKAKAQGNTESSQKPQDAKSCEELNQSMP